MNTDDVYEEIGDDDDFAPEDPKPPKRNPYAPLPIEGVKCETALAKIVQGHLYRGKRGVNLLGAVDGDDYSEDALQTMFPALPEMERELGRELLRALLNHDEQFPNEVMNAIRDVDALFNRSNLKVLIDRLMPAVGELDDCPTKRETRQLAEKRLGRKLYNEEWNRLQHRFRWDEKPKG